MVSATSRIQPHSSIYQKTQEFTCTLLGCLCRGKPKGVSAWEEKYNELQQYIHEKGDANVPTKYAANRALGRWVSTQRNMYKKYHGGASFNSLLPAEIERRIELLNQLGFIWNMAPTSGSDDPDQKEGSQQDDSDCEGEKKGR